jgi:hypothetical protein
MAWLNRHVATSRGKVALALALVAAVLVTRTTRRDGESHFLATQRYEDVYYLPPPAWLELFSLGHGEAVAGLIWLKALLYFGDELVHRGDVSNLYRYTDAMLALDPYFRRVYRWVATSALYRTGEVTAEDARRVIEYLERGVRLFPDDGELAWDLGANYTYELVPLLPIGEARDEARRKGIEHLRVAALRGAGPTWLVLSTASEMARLGQREQQIAHLEEAYAQIDDPATRKAIEAQLARLRSANFAEALRRTFEDLEARRRAEFPYLPADLYVLIGPRPPFDGDALRLRHFDPAERRFDAGEAEQPIGADEDAQAPPAAPPDPAP